MEDFCCHLYVKHLVQHHEKRKPRRLEMIPSSILVLLTLLTLLAQDTCLFHRPKTCGVRTRVPTKRSDTIRLFRQVPSYGNYYMALGPLQNARSRSIFGKDGENEPRSPFHPRGRGWLAFPSSSSSSFLQTRPPESSWMRGLCN